MPYFTDLMRQLEQGNFLDRLATLERLTRQTEAQVQVGQTNIANHVHVEAHIVDLLHNAVQLQGRDISDSAPGDGYVLVWRSSTSLWTPEAQDAAKLRGRNVSSATPDDQAALVWCASAAQWEPGQPVSGGGGNASQLQGRNISASPPADGDVLTWQDSASEWAPVAPLCGSAGNAIEIQGRSVASTAPSAGEVLRWSGSDWVPSASINAVELQGRSVANTAPSAGEVLRWSGSDWAPSASINATQLRGRDVADASPASRDALTWNASASQWSPCAVNLQWFQNHYGEPTISTTAQCTKGFLLEPAANLTVWGVGMITDEATTQSLVLRICQLSGSIQVGSPLYSSPSFAGPGERTFVYQLCSPPITLSAGSRYTVALSNVTPGATVVRVGYQNWPSDRRVGHRKAYTLIVTACPDAGSAWTVAMNNNPHSGGVLYQL